MLGQRKHDHLRICLNEDVHSGLTTGFGRFQFVHQALPEMALADVDTSSSFLGHALKAPILISAMTGGTSASAQLNQRLATVAQDLGLAMSLGSHRAGIADPRVLGTYQVREYAPDILLLANLGAVQLNCGFGIAECVQAVESVQADALVLHLNPLQEALQPGGDTDFSGLTAKIGEVCHGLECPVIVKEVGWGLSDRTAQALLRAGVSALDIGGAGGTSWSEVERHRAESKADAQVASAFIDWGIPTVDSLIQVRRACPKLPLVASGGVTSGIDVAMCLALGADVVGMARALLGPAMDSTEAIADKLSLLLRQLRTAMFCVGSRRVSDLDETLLVRS